MNKPISFLPQGLCMCDSVCLVGSSPSLSSYTHFQNSSPASFFFFFFARKPFLTTLLLSPWKEGFLEHHSALGHLQTEAWIRFSLFYGLLQWDPLAVAVILKQRDFEWSLQILDVSYWAAPEVKTGKR